MPKMKTHRGARKRFKISASGLVRHKRTNKSHKLEKKTARRKRRLGQAGTLGTTDARRVRAMLNK